MAWQSGSLMATLTKDDTHRYFDHKVEYSKVLERLQEYYTFGIVRNL
jgi:hypothetical protein